jgi:hypothetical protein
MLVLVQRLLVLVRQLLVVLVQMLLVLLALLVLLELLLLLLLLLLEGRAECCTVRLPLAWLPLVCLLRCHTGDSSTQLLQVWSFTILRLQRAVVLPHRPPSWDDGHRRPPVCVLRTPRHTPSFLLHRPRVHGLLVRPLLPAVPTLLHTA